MKYEYFIFDADDTLFDFKTCSRRAFDNTCQYLQLANYNEAYAIYKKINNQVWSEFQNGKSTMDDVRVKRFFLFLERLNLDVLRAEEISEYYLSEIVNHTTLLSGAKEVLHQLSKNMTLVLATNGIKSVQEARLKKTDLEKYFDHIIISESLGVAKPNYGFFAHIHELIKTPEKDSVLMIGDNPESDIRGANNFGYETCLLQRYWHPQHELCNPNHVIESLPEILEL
jgi:YjjG family noncanonical pyrimidine nucleotidase